MSDNIDYDELDRAVNEALKSSATKTTAKPVVKKTTPTPKPVVKSTTPKVAPKPAHHGYYMDFVAKRPVASTPIAKPIARPVAKPLAQPVRPVARPVAHPVAHSDIMRPAAQVRRPVTARPANQGIAQQLQQRQQVAQSKVAAPAVKPVAKPAVKPAAKPSPVKPAATPEVAKAPNANNYSLGGRSPFMINTKVDKRPLGTNIPETSTHALLSTRNTYSQKDPSTTKRHKAQKHIVTESPKKHSGWLWTLLVIAIIAAGAGLGYLAYILVFAN